MGHKQSTLHRQLKQTSDGPSRDLVGDGSAAGGSNGQAPTPYFDVKQGPFKRKLSVRNISIRRSFHIPKKSSHKRLNSVAPSASTTDDIVASSSSTSTALNNSPFVQFPPLPSTTSNNHNTPTSTSAPSNSTNNNNNVTANGGVGGGGTPYAAVDGPSTSTASVSLPARAGSFSRSNGDRHVMDRIRKSFRNSFRRKKSIPESIKPHQWQADEIAVKAGNCVFGVKYLGCVEVFESRGMQICEDALRRLRSSRRRAVKGTLYVTGDGLRVVDDETKGLLVDQTIEKVSFCAPDRSHERGFSYICRDGTTRRWMCHGFHASKDSGERLSHAVGCAFAVCLERKQRRDKEAVSSVFDTKTATFTRTGSFRASSITERMQDPQVAKAADPIPMKPVHNPYAVERPHAVASLLQRQGSLRGGPLNQVSPFKRQLSLRLGIDSLPTTLGSPTEGSATSTVTTSGLVNSVSSTASGKERERAHSVDFTAKVEQSSMITPLKRPSLFGLGSKVTLAPSVAPIQEVSPSTDRDLPTANSTIAAGDDIAAMCQELSQGLTMLTAMTTEDEQNSAFSSGHFSPPLDGGSTAASFSAFDKWISTNSNNGSMKRPTLPPPVVDQMPQVTAPPPPSSPSFGTTVTFSPSLTTFGRSPASATSASSSLTSKTSTTDYHSSLFSDLANSLKDNMAAPTLTSTTTVQPPLPPPPTLSSSTFSNHNGGASFSVTNGNSANTFITTKVDPFDADWVELTNRKVFEAAVETAPTSSSETTESVALPSPPPPLPSTIPYKSTNPFLDLSQLEMQEVFSEVVTATSNSPPSAVSPTAQMVTAFEVQM